MKVKVIGHIVPDAWGWIYDKFGIANFCPAKLRAALEDPANAADREVILEVNSPGGDVWAGFDTYSLIQALNMEGYHTEAHVTVMAASAASTIISACRSVLLSPVAQVMIHDPACYTEGNIRDHRESLSFLQSIKESIINGYLARCGGKTSRQKFRDLMDRSTWLTAQQAIDIGLADGILGDAPIDGVPVVMNSAPGFEEDDVSFEALMARYERGVLDGSIEEDPQHPVNRESAVSAPVAAVNDAAEDKIPEAVQDYMQQRAIIDLKRRRYRQ